MTVPAVWVNACVVVALVTEIFLVGMTLQTGILKADPYLLTLAVHVPPVTIPQGLISQFIEELHVGGNHELRIFYTLFLGHLLDLGCVELWLWPRCGCPGGVPEGEGEYTYEYDQSGYDFSCIIHLQFPPIPPQQVPCQVFPRP